MSEALWFKSANNTAFINAVKLNGTLVPNGAFETLMTSSYIYRPTGATWTFLDNAGEQQNQGRSKKGVKLFRGKILDYFGVHKTFV